MKVLTQISMTFVMLAIFVVMVGIATTYPGRAPGSCRCGRHPRDPPVPATDRPRRGARRTKRSARGIAQRNGIAQERMVADDRRAMTFEAAHMAPQVTVSRNPTASPKSRELSSGLHLALVAGICFFGYAPTIPVFILLFLRWEAKCSWLKAALYAGIGASLLLFIFTYVAEVPASQGLSSRSAFWTSSLEPSLFYKEWRRRGQTRGEMEGAVTKHFRKGMAAGALVAAITGAAQAQGAGRRGLLSTARR